MNLGDVGEFGFLAQLRSRLPKGTATVGPGDDAAVLDGRLAVTTDVLLEGVHFRTDWSSWIDIGYRAAAVNISDLAAMGARPRWLLCGLGAPADMPVGALHELAIGLGSCGAELVGGDMVRSAQVVISVTAIGELDGPALLRTGARPGDVLSVTGPLGDAGAGVRLLDLGERHGPLIEAHRRPVPRINEGLELRREGVHAAMDLSDGLASDVRRIAEASEVGVEIDAEALPISAHLREACETHSWDPVALALGGGEDYELLVADPQPRGHVVGRVVESGCWLIRNGRREPLPDAGWDHYR